MPPYMHLGRGLIMVMALLSLGFGALGWVASVQAGVVPERQSVQVFAFNDLGMHCYDSDFSVFSLLPPFNTIHGQVVAKGFRPQLLNNTAVSLSYRATNSTIYDFINNPPNPPDPWSLNTTSISSPGIYKTNFWDYFSSLFGMPSPPPDVGILGAKMPSAAFGPQPLGAYDATHRWFSATGIPLTNIDDRGKINPFPMMRIATPDSLRAGLHNGASLDIVTPVSSEMNCISCHETAAFANYQTTFSDASPPPRIGDPPGAGLLQQTDFSSDPNPNIRFRENVLLLHDALGSYGGLNASYPNYIAAAYPGYNSLMQVHQAGTSILCATCHYSKALDLAGTGPNALQAPHLYLSRAMHKHHGTSWPMLDGMGTYVIPIPGAYTTPATPSECYYCHPGNDTQCLRSVMATKGMSCQNCHGDLLALAGFTPQLATDGFVDPYLPNVSDAQALHVNLTTTGQQRRPWQDLPKCQSCHYGDAVNHLGPANAPLIGQMAYDPNDPAATPLIPPNQRFAENPDQLYRFSQTHGGMACASCHGSPHAEWPARIDGNDNITAMQIQGHTGEIAECGACHFPMPPNQKGPHGLHSVNDKSWIASHGAFQKKNPQSCQACHGPNYQGTVLSKAKADRVLFYRKNQHLNISQGTPVNCYGCHKTIR